MIYGVALQAMSTTTSSSSLTSHHLKSSTTIHNSLLASITKMLCVSLFTRMIKIILTITPTRLVDPQTAAHMDHPINCQSPLQD